MKIRDLIIAKAIVGGGGVTPEGNQDITTLDEYNVADKATARVSAAERAKIIPENIKKDVEILGVVGSREGVDIEQLDVTENGVYTAPAGKAYSPILVAVSGDEFNLASFLAGTMTDVVVSAPSLRKNCFRDYTGMTSFTDEVLASMGQYCFSGCSGLTSFIASALLEVLPERAFENCSALSIMDLSHIREIKDFALYGCRMFSPGTLSVSVIGANGCHEVGSRLGSQEAFIYAPAEKATVGANAFEISGLSEIRGSFGDIGGRAFSNCRRRDGLGNYTSSLKRIESQIIGEIASNAFENNDKVEYVDFSGSDIKSIGSRAFYNLGRYRSYPANTPLLLDFRNCSFPKLTDSCLGYLMDTVIRLPPTLITIETSSFTGQYRTKIYFSDVPPAVLSSTYAFDGSYTIFVPYNQIVPYRTATNWSSSTIQKNIKGYALANTFTDGEILPGYTKQGYAVTWYSDESLTNVVTTCPAGSPELYCTVAATQSKVVISVGFKGNGTLSVIDSSSNPVDISNGYFLADVGDVFTLNAGSSEAGDVVDLAVDGVSQSSPYTLTIGSSEVGVVVTAYSSQIEPDFDVATWQQLKLACDLGQTFIYANFVGHTKTVTLSNGETLTYRLVDASGGCYELADGTRYAGLIFEPTTCLNATARMNASQTNVGGYAVSEMATITIPAFVSLLPSDVSDVISEIKLVRDAGGNSGALSSINCKAFIPAEKEISVTRSYSSIIEFGTLLTFEYYKSHTTASDRAKGKAYWLSSAAQNGTQFLYVNTKGAENTSYSNSNFGVAPCFAI